MVCDFHRWICWLNFEFESEDTGLRVAIEVNFRALC